MGAPKGNNYWQFRNKHGRDHKYTPEALWEEFVKYQQWIEENPLYESKAFSYEGNITIAKLPKMRAMTIIGFCLFADIDQSTFDNYRKNKDFIGVATRIEGAIKSQKFEGAAAELLNPNIIARDLGLKDKVENENKNVNINKDMTDEEFLNEMKNLGVRNADGSGDTN